jgi:hypothetical protein
LHGSSGSAYVLIRRFCKLTVISKTGCAGDIPPDDRRQRAYLSVAQASARTIGSKA